MPWGITGRLTGLENVLKQLEVLKKGVRNRILRRAIVKACRGLVTLAKAKAPVDTGQDLAPGLYRKAIGMKVGTVKGGVVGRIGARVGFKTIVRFRARGRLTGQPVYQDPAKIGHLVELGHGGPSPAPPHPHLRPAWDEGRAKAEETVRREVLAGIKAELRK